MPNHSFSPVAAFYDTLASLVFGKNLKIAQAENLRYITNNASILIIGGGSGWILKQVLACTQNSKIVYLEASASMLCKAEKLNQAAEWSNKIEYRLGTEESIRSQEKFDIIISNFFLDLFSPAYLPLVIEKLYNALTPAGLMLITDFKLPEKRNFFTWSARLLIKSMYLFFGITCGISATTLPDWEIYLRQYSWIELKSRYFYHGLLKSAAFQKI